MPHASRDRRSIAIWKPTPRSGQRPTKPSSNPRTSWRRRRRAIEGVVRLKFSEGNPIQVDGKLYEDREYGDTRDTLLMFLLRARHPEVFGDKVKFDGDIA